MTNALLTFLYRNGYPLVFAMFASAKDIGLFRLEERLAFAITFVVLLVETLIMKPFIKKLGKVDGRALWPVYLKFLAAGLAPTVLLSGICAYLITQPAIRDLLALSPEGDWKAIIFISAPFFVFVHMNTLVLNLKGKFKIIAVNMIMIFALFVGLAVTQYPGAGLGGLRLAYGLAGILGAAFVAATTLWSLGMLTKTPR